MIENKRIIFLTLSLCKGGAENQLVKLSIFFKQRGFDVAIINVLPRNDFKEDLVKNGIENNYFNVKSISGFIKLLKFVKNQRPDLMIAFMYGANIIARFLKLTFKFPIITSVRGSHISKLYALLYRLTYKIDDVSTFNSQYTLNMFIENHLIAASKSVLVKNAVKIELVNPIKNTINNAPFKLISIAHIRPEKDYKTLFKAIQILNNNGEDVQLAILGHTFGSNWALNEIDQLGITEVVNILGFVQDNEKYLDTSDALILSSFGEGSPNAILEAMSRKIPVIASNVVGCDKLVNESGCGFLFERGNAEDLAIKIMQLKMLTHHDRAALGNKGYKYVCDNFDENLVVESWLTIVNNILKTTAVA